MANKGARLKPLLESAIINFSFDYNEWPSTHADTTRMIRPFNGSLQGLRHEYSKIFGDLWRADEKKEQIKLSGTDNYEKYKEQQSQEKQYSIRYTVNLLPSVDETTDHGTIIQNLT